MIKDLKENKGITLIALVITIIVLLILAGVAISMLSGENGILNQAAKAKTETEEKSTEEAVKLAATAAMTNVNYSIDQAELEKELTNAFGEKGTGYTITGDAENGWKVEANGQKYLIEASGEVGEASQTIPVDDYGAEVTNYEVGDTKYKDPNMKWRIFLDDGNNIYLIANDYIHKDYGPQSKGGKDLSGTDYDLFMENVYQDYTGSTDIVNNAKFASTLDKYHKWAKSHNSGTNDNIKAVAYMLDTSENVWGKYANSDYAEYAIGGPTLEMFCESYNKAHTYKQIGVNETESSNGYKVKWSDTGSYGPPISGLDTTEKDNLWVISDSSKASAMWLASPSAGYSSDLMDVTYDGIVDSNAFDGSFPGFRPLVCLKSGVQLEKQDDETYQILEKN